jgi:hypothetical protein
VPFVIVSAVYVPNVIHIFMTIMVTKGLGEFIECLIPARFPLPQLSIPTLAASHPEGNLAHLYAA